MPEGFEIPGVRITYPDTAPGAAFSIIAALGVVAVVGMICWTLLELPHDTQKEVIGTWSTYFLSDSSQAPIEGTYLIQFWTPSPSTASFADVDAWEREVGEEQLRRFGDELKANRHVVGYRRWEVLGQGSTPFKQGYWWVVTVRRPFSLEDLERTYRGFWKDADPLYVEVVDGGGSYTPGPN